jgi:hypothetical protein
MKKLLLTGVAALFLATGTAHARDIDEQVGVWHFRNYKRCTATTEFIVPRTAWNPTGDEWPTASEPWPPLERGGPSTSVLEKPAKVEVIFEQSHLANLEAAVRFLKKCRAWAYDRHRQCNDRKMRREGTCP